MTGPAGPPWWLPLLGMLLSGVALLLVAPPLGVCVVTGTTLGWLATWQIRRSQRL